MKMIALYDLTHGGKFVPQGSQFECSDACGAELQKRGFKPATKPKKAKPAAGGGGK